MNLMGLMDRANRGVGKFVIGLSDGSTLGISRFTLIADDSGDRAELDDYRVRSGGFPSEAKAVEIRLDAIDWIAKVESETS